MHKVFEDGFRPRGGADGGNLFQIQFARQHDLAEAGILQKARLLRRADVRLRAGMQLDWRQVHFQQAHVLDDDGIHAGVVQLPDLLAHGLQLVVAQDGVLRDEDACMVAVCVLHQARNVLHAVGGVHARAKGRAADVDGIGAMVDGFDADIGVTGGAEQFELVREHGKSARQQGRAAKTERAKRQW